MDLQKEFEKETGYRPRLSVTENHPAALSYVDYLESQLTASRTQNEKAERILKSLIAGKITEDDAQWAKHIINKRESE